MKSRVAASATVVSIDKEIYRFVKIGTALVSAAIRKDGDEVSGSWGDSLRDNVTTVKLLCENERPVPSLAI